MKKLLATTALAASLAAAATGTAHADLYRLNSIDTSGLLTAVVSAPGRSAVDVYMGGYPMSITDLTTATDFTQVVYCTDLLTEFVAGQTYDLTNTFPLSAELGAMLANAPQSTVTQTAALQAAIWDVQNPGFTVTSISGDDGTFATNYAADVLLATTTTVPEGHALADYVPDDGGVNQSFGYLDALPVHTDEPSSAAIFGSLILCLVACVTFVRRLAGAVRSTDLVVAAQ